MRSFSRSTLATTIVGRADESIAAAVHQHANMCEPRRTRGRDTASDVRVVAEEHLTRRRAVRPFRVELDHRKREVIIGLRHGSEELLGVRAVGVARAQPHAPQLEHAARPCMTRVVKDVWRVRGGEGERARGSIPLA